MSARPATRLAWAAQRVALAVLVAFAALVASCAKRADDSADTPQGPPPMSEEEQLRGRQACAAFAERVCRCAGSEPSLAEDCRFAKARVEAVDTTLRIVNDGHGRMAINDQIASQTGARRVIQKCFEADAALNPKSCPRAPSPPSPAPPSPAAAE